MSHTYNNATGTWNWTAAGQFTLENPALPYVENMRAGYANGNAKQRRRQIRAWKRAGWRVLSHRPTGGWASTTNGKER